MAKKVLTEGDKAAKDEQRRAEVEYLQNLLEQQADARGRACPVRGCGKPRRATIRGLVCNNPQCPDYGYGPVGGEPD